MRCTAPHTPTWKEEGGSDGCDVQLISQEGCRQGGHIGPPPPCAPGPPLPLCPVPPPTPMPHLEKLITCNTCSRMLLPVERAGFTPLITPPKMRE